MAIVSGTSRHPKDVPFVSFGGGRTVFSTISPRKEQISAIGARKAPIKRGWRVLPPRE